jgi:acetoin utilization deacetylase AcuC-like enzyme
MGKGWRNLSMKVIFHGKYTEVYACDPAAQAGRMEAICKALEGAFEFEEPDCATDRDLELCHTKGHIQYVKEHSPSAYMVGKLAVGGAIKAAELACDGEPAFGLIRPPGHHASQNSCWGFCYFNNMAISVRRLCKEKKIKRAVILDIDLHYGDGTANIFKDAPEVTYFHPEGYEREGFMENLVRDLEGVEHYDILAISAGFDRHEEDWGRLLTTDDYGRIGELVKEHVLRKCSGRRYCLLEGGYNHGVLGHNVRALLEGLD